VKQCAMVYWKGFINNIMMKWLSKSSSYFQTVPCLELITTINYEWLVISAEEMFVRGEVSGLVETKL
jgi:hypothetical protein